jgi:L-asparaginase
MTLTLFTLGGTIAMAGSRDGVVTRLTGAELAAGVPGLAGLGETLDVRDAQAVPSASLTYADILAVADAATEAIRVGSHGIVVTQGTDSLEETAYLLDLVWPHEEPIVVTGAMRNPTLAGPDGPANLLAAARVAAAEPARGLGALVVMNDEIHAARWVRKTHATSTAAFASPDTGPIGQVIEGGVRILVHPQRHAPLSRPDDAGLASTVVPLHTITLDDDATLLTLLADGGIPADGLVIAAMGVGHVPAALAPVLEQLAGRMPVALCSRTGAGSVLRHTYGAVGSERDLQRRGLINGGLLHPYKARVLLRMLLAGKAGPQEIREVFALRG